jgi:hypothetical protein
VGLPRQKKASKIGGGRDWKIVIHNLHVITKLMDGRDMEPSNYVMKSTLAHEMNPTFLPSLFWYIGNIIPEQPDGNLSSNFRLRIFFIFFISSQVTHNYNN